MVKVLLRLLLCSLRCSQVSGKSAGPAYQVESGVKVVRELTHPSYDICLPFLASQVWDAGHDVYPFPAAKFRKIRFKQFAEIGDITTSFQVPKSYVWISLLVIEEMSRPWFNA